MYNDKKKHNKILSMVSMIILIYVFTLSLGYAFFSEELVISGNVSTASGKPKECPLEMQKIASPGFSVDDYFVESMPYAMGGGELSKAMREVLGSINFYDKKTNTASFYGNMVRLDYSVGTDLIERLSYTAPIYIALKNVSSYDLKNWTIKIDYENVRKDENGQPVVNVPLDYFDMWRELSSPDDDFSVWNYPTDFSDSTYDFYEENSFFKNANFASELFPIRDAWEDITGYDYRGYSVKDFYNRTDGVKFETEPIGMGEYIVIGIMFPKVSITEDAPVEMDGLSFKIYENSFSEESAFKVRMAFDTPETFDNWKTIQLEFPSGFQEKFESEHPVPWWQ